MSIVKALAFSSLALVSWATEAAQPVIDLSAGGKLTPGVYGQVKFGKEMPPLVNPEPMSIVIYSVPRKIEPIYLHVPPEHAQQWEEHCREYKACDRPTYFVKSREYEPGYVPPKGKAKAAKDKPVKADQGKRGDRSRNGSGDGSGDGSGSGGRNKAKKNSGKRGGGDGSGGGAGRNKANKSGSRAPKHDEDE